MELEERREEQYMELYYTGDGPGKEPWSSSLGNRKLLSSHSYAFWEALSNPADFLWGFFTWLADDSTYVSPLPGLLCMGLLIVYGVPLSLYQEPSFGREHDLMTLFLAVVKDQTWTSTHVRSALFH